MAKRLNKNVVVGLTVAGMALTTAAGVLMVLRLPKTDPGPIAEQAKIAADKGEYAQAWKLYGRAAGRAKAAGDRDKANEYLILAGDASLSSGDAQRARKLWNEVLLSDPMNLKAQEKTVGFLLEYAEHATVAWPEVQIQAEKLISIATKNNTKSYLGLNALGRALTNQRGVKESNAEEGKKNLIAAAAGDKGNPRFARDLAAFYVGEGDVKSAVATYDALVANLPKAPAEPVKDAGQQVKPGQAKSDKDARTDQARAYLYRGQFYAMRAVQDKVPEADKLAVADLEKAVSVAPTDIDTLVGLADYWHARKLRAVLDKAPAAEIEEYRTKSRQQYEKAIMADPDHYSAYLQLAQLLGEDDKYDDALSVLNKRIERGIKREHYLGWRNQRFMLMVRQKAFAVLVAKLYNVTVAPDVEGEEFKQKSQPIVDQLNRLYKETVGEAMGGADEPLALYMHGRLLMINDDPYGAIKDFKRLLDQTHSQDPDVHRLLGQLYAQTGAPGLAEESLRIVVAADPNEPGAHAMLATVLNQLNRPDEALNEADRALQLDPAVKMATNAKMQAYQLQRNYEGVKQMQKLFTPGEGSAEDKYNRAVLLQIEVSEGQGPDPNKLAEAERLLRELIATDPANFNALHRLVIQLAQHQETVPQAIEVLNTARANVEKLRAQAAATQPAGERAKQLADMLNGIELMKVMTDPAVASEEKYKQREALVRKGTDPYNVAINLCQLYNEQGRLDEAFAAAKEAYKLKPNEPRVVDITFRYALNRKDWKLAEELADKAVTLGLDPSGGRFYRGRLFAARTDLPDHYDLAVKELRQGITAVPTYAEGYALLAEVIANLKQYEEADRLFQQARKLNPRNVTAAIGLAQLAAVRGDAEEQQKNLQIAAQLAPNHPWVLSEMQDQEDRSNPKGGIQRREKLRTQNPKNTDNLLRLANLYARDNRPDQAQATFEECRQIRPDDLLIAREYATFLMNKVPPDTKAIRQILTDVVQKTDPKDPRKKAGAQLLLASSLRAQFNNRVAGAPTRQEVDAAYLAAVAIANIPPVLLDVGNYFAAAENVEKSEEYYRKAIEGKDPADRDIRQQAFRLLLQSELNHNDPKTAPTVQKEIDAYRDAFPGDNLYLIFQGHFYTTLGRDSDAIKAYSDFIAKETQLPLGYYQRGLAYFRQSEWKLATADLREAKRLAPGTVPPRLLLAVALENTQQVDAAISELQGLLEEKPDAIAGLSQLLGIYLKLKRYEAAESLITSFSKKNPDDPRWDGYRMQIALARNATDQAVEFARKAIEKSKGNLMAVDTLLSVYADAQRYDDLINYIETKLTPEQRKEQLITMRLAAAYLGKKDFERGLSLAAGAMAAGPNLAAYVDVYYRAMTKGNRDEALKAVRERAQKEPQNRALKLLQAVTESATSHAAESAKLYRELLASMPAGNDAEREKPVVMQQLALQLYNQKEFKEARKVYEEILQSNPNDASTLNNLAYMLLEEFNDPSAALPHSRRAVMLVPDYTKNEKLSVLDTLGWNFVLLGMYEQAIPTLQKGIELNSQVPSIHYHLAECFYRRSKAPNAQTPEDDTKRATAEVQQTYELIKAAGVDTENTLPKLVDLGAKLGLKLDKNAVPATK